MFICIDRKRLWNDGHHTCISKCELTYSHLSLDSSKRSLTDFWTNSAMQSWNQALHLPNSLRNAKVCYSLSPHMTYTFPMLSMYHWLGISDDERIHLLETNKAFADAHAQAAIAGQSTDADCEHPPHAYTCFIQAHDASTENPKLDDSCKRLIELNGGRNGPIDRGPSTDLLRVSKPFIPSCRHSLVCCASDRTL